MKGKISNALSLALIMAMLVTSFAFADAITADADALVLAGPHPNGVTANQDGGTTVSYDFSAAILETGNATNDVFPGSVSVTISMSGAWLSGGTSGPWTFTAFNSAQVGKIDITIPCGSAGTTQTMTINLQANDSTNGKSLSPNSQNLSYVITADPDDPASCASDTTAPTITINTPVDDATYLLNEVVNADYFCEDEAGGSGLASCVGTVADDAAIDTSTVGSHSFTVDAADNAENTASLTHNYSVIYDWNGFFQPIDNNALNVAKGGSAIPVKFSLSGNQGLNIFETGYPRSVKISCDSNASEDVIEVTVNAGGSSLSYDALVDQYVYVWKTEKLWAGTCRQLQVKLNDGTLHTANFKFK